MILKIDLGFLTTVPEHCWCSHTRGKNWLAKIHKDPSSPGGLGRAFCERGKGEYYYGVSNLNRGDAVEFGADYYSGSGRKNPTRVYAVVLNRSESELEIETYATAAKAIKAAKELLEKPVEETATPEIDLLALGM